MKLFEISNGYTGFSSVSVFIIAIDEETALELACEKFKKSAINENYPDQVEQYNKLGWDISNLKEYRYPANYWFNLHAECLCEDVSKEFVSEVNE